MAQLFPRARDAPHPIELPRAEPAPAVPGPQDDFAVLGVSDIMLSSLPPMASGADVYMRQFYRAGSTLPSRRYLPLRGL